MSADLPLHIQIVLHLRSQVEARKREHEEKVGRGLEDREYQRYVGRIAECKAVLEVLEQLKSSGLEEIEDFEEAQRSDSSNKTTQRRRSRV